MGVVQALKKGYLMTVMRSKHRPTIDFIDSERRVRHDWLMLEVEHTMGRKRWGNPKKLFKHRIRKV